MELHRIWLFCTPLQYGIVQSPLWGGVQGVAYGQQKAHAGRARLPSSPLTANGCGGQPRASRGHAIRGWTTDCQHPGVPCGTIAGSRFRLRGSHGLLLLDEKLHLCSRRPRPLDALAIIGDRLIVAFRDGEVATWNPAQYPRTILHGACSRSRQRPPFTPPGGRCDPGL